MATQSTIGYLAKQAGVNVEFPAAEKWLAVAAGPGSDESGVVRLASDAASHRGAASLRRRMGECMLRLRCFSQGESIALRSPTGISLAWR